MKSTAENLRIDILNRHISESILRALRGESYLDPEILKIHGFATPTMRHLFSNLCHIESASYLEVGVFCGATFFAAYNNNPITAQGVENFAQPFEETNVREQLESNFDRWWKSGGGLCQIEFKDVFKIEWHPEILDIRYNIYFYDGEHSYESQAKALPALFDMMADTFLYIVDDTNWDDVIRGTDAGFETLGSRVVVEKTWNLSGLKSRSDDEIWHNGMAIFLCSKIK